MKKLLLFICLFGALCFQGKTQQYQPIFGNESTEWIMPSYYVAVEQGEWKMMDTISVVGIEDEYKILEYKSPINEGFSSPAGKIRANETNSKLYFIQPNFTAEVLIMDLDLEVGDEFILIFRLITQDIERKIFVDSVYVLDGKKHIRFDDEIGDTFSGETKRMFIEGVGPNWGFDFSGLVACKYDDFVLIYSFENEYIKDCNIVKQGSYIDNTISENTIKIYPNPVFEYAVISISEIFPENVYLTVYNAVGAVVLKRTISEIESTLDLSYLPSSVYYFKLQSSDATITKKIIKH